MSLYCMTLVADGIGEFSYYYFISDLSAKEVESYFSEIFEDFKITKNIYKSIDKIVATIPDGKTLERVEPARYNYYW